MQLSELRRALSIVRDVSQPPGERAIAAAILAADGSSEESGAGEERAFDRAQRMYAYGVLHDDAIPWDGNSTRSGTITHVEDDRVEQYVGRSIWVAYGMHVFGGIRPSAGDQLRIARRNGSIEIECIGPNRLGGRAQIVRRARSGMLVQRQAQLAEGELEKAASAVAERYGAVLNAASEQITIDFAGGASLILTPASDAIRLDVEVQSDRPNDACDAERALILSAALLTLDEGSTIVDDTSAHFTAESIYQLARRNGMRADSFRFAAATAQRVFPVAQPRVFDDSSNELTIFSSRASNSNFAFATLGRALQSFATVGQACEDPIVPPYMEGVMPEDRGEPGSLQPLAQLAYDTIEIGIAFADAILSTGALTERISRRGDVEALLGEPIRSAVMFAIRKTGDVSDSQAALQMRRADALVTALAAIFARDDASAVASDANGVLFSPTDLTELALCRQGISTTF